MITAAISGSRPTKKMNPAVPYTPKEMITAAVECFHAGASIVHIHARDPDTGVVTDDIDLYREILEGIREKCDIIVNFTTSSAFVDPKGKGDEITKRRLQVVDLKPDLCSFDVGSINLQNRTFINPPDFTNKAPIYMKERGVKPEIEVFDTGHIYQAIDLINKGLFESPPYFTLVMGVKWGIPATVENLLFMKQKLPTEAEWSVLGVGRTQDLMVAMGILLGGHIRVGFEDNIYIKKGILAKNNAEFVDRAAELSTRMGREVVTPSEARTILKIQQFNTKTN